MTGYLNHPPNQNPNTQWDFDLVDLSGGHTVVHAFWRNSGIKIDASVQQSSYIQDYSHICIAALQNTQCMDGCVEDLGVQQRHDNHIWKILAWFSIFAQKFADTSLCSILVSGPEGVYWGFEPSISYAFKMFWKYLAWWRNIVSFSSVFLISKSIQEVSDPKSDMPIWSYQPKIDVRFSCRSST